MKQHHIDILYFVRLFSGLENSILEEDWKPTGVPTIHKVLEALDKNYKCQIVFCSKALDTGGFSRGDLESNRWVKFEKFTNPVFICGSYDKQLKLFSKKMRIIARELIHLYKLISFISTTKPSLIYFDHSNIYIAAVAHWLFRKDVKFVFRVMGVYPSMRIMDRKDILARFTCWCYRRPFDLALGTQDGSGTESWMKEYLSSATKTAVLVNGMDKAIADVDRMPKVYKTLISFKTIVFVGKLECYKGIYEFIEGCHKFLSTVNEPEKFRVVIIGVGKEKENILSEQRRREYSHLFVWESNLEHSILLRFLKTSWVYISCNKLGGLSNANLDAIYAGNNMIIRRESSGQFFSVLTTYLGNHVMYVDSDSDGNSIAKELARLCNKNYYEEKKFKFKKLSSLLIRSWDERVYEELAILSRYV